MKKNLVLILALALSTSAFANELKCWKTTFKTPKTPFMSATIVSNDTIADVKFLYKQDNSAVTLNDVPGKTESSLITSNHSPYKGNQQFDLKGVGALILPRSLANDDLVRVEPNGLGYQKGENGVIITSRDDGDGEGGNHISFRLSCRADK